MFCWERDIYLNLVIEYQEKKMQKMNEKGMGESYFNV
jgi:hypothetical protein